MTSAGATKESTSIAKITKKRQLNQVENHQKTLFVSGLRADVKKSDISRHFIGCVKVTLKRSQMASRLR